MGHGLEEGGGIVEADGELVALIGIEANVCR